VFSFKKPFCFCWVLTEMRSPCQFNMSTQKTNTFLTCAKSINFYGQNLFVVWVGNLKLVFFHTKLLLGKEISENKFSSFLDHPKRWIWAKKNWPWLGQVIFWSGQVEVVRTFSGPRKFSSKKSIFILLGQKNLFGLGQKNTRSFIECG